MKHVKNLNDPSEATLGPQTIRGSNSHLVHEAAQNYGNQFAEIYARSGKRVLDIGLVLLGGIFLAPVMIIIALIIKLQGGPVFYSQSRIGLDGKEFRFWKFRTMVCDADARLEAHLKTCPQAAREWQISQKLREDPRVTTFGKLLRKSSLDELPQLWNVLRGDMSLVGPRPMMPDQKDLYPGNDYDRFRPGITGLWQISERNNVSFADRARYDTAYAREVGLMTDLQILFKTVGVVFKGSGY